MNWLIQKLARKYCMDRSPEGTVCTRERNHEGLCCDNRGSGFAWGKTGRNFKETK